MYSDNLLGAPSENRNSYVTSLPSDGRTDSTPVANRWHKIHGNSHIRAGQANYELEVFIPRVTTQYTVPIQTAASTTTNVTVPIDPTDVLGTYYFLKFFINIESLTITQNTTSSNAQYRAITGVAVDTGSSTNSPLLGVKIDKIVLKTLGNNRILI